MVTLATWVTIARMAFIPAFIGALYLPVHYANTVAAVVFAILALSDGLDGWIARKTKTVSKVGAILDPLADKLLVSAALIFLIGKGVDAWMAYVIIARELLVTGGRLLVPNIVQVSWLGKAKTVTQIVAVLMVLLQLPFAWYAMLIATLLTVWSGVDYVWKARKSLD